MIPRRPRVLLAVAVLCLVSFLTFQHRHALSEFRPDYFPVGSPRAMRLPATGTLDPEPHKLASADAFRSHFAAAIRLPGLTLAEAKKTCTWPKDQYVNFQYPADAEWVVKDRPEHEIAMRREQWQEYVRGHMIPWDRVRDKFEGRGIVVLAGNNDTLMRLKVILRRLVRLGTTIPVEVHYWDTELSAAMRDELASLYPRVAFNDLSRPHNIMRPKAKNQFWVNFQLKTAALVNSRFAEPLLLDSDNVPVLDPLELYESRAYREYHTVFWPDIARTWPQNPAWAITNTPCRMDEYEQESGQLLVDKRRYWYHLQLAAWLNNEHGKYYNEFLLGDKDMFRYAWHALKTPFGRPAKWLTSVGNENDGFYCGHHFAQHHPDDGRVAFMHGGLSKITALEVMRWNKEERGGYFRHYKRAPSDEDPSTSVHVAIIFDGAEYKPNHTEKFRVAMCTDMKDVGVAPLDDILPGWEQEFEELGGFWMLEEEKNDEEEKKDEEREEKEEEKEEEEEEEDSDKEKE